MSRRSVSLVAGLLAGGTSVAAAWLATGSGDLGACLLGMLAGVAAGAAAALLGVALRPVGRRGQTRLWLEPGGAEEFTGHQLFDFR